MRVSDIMTVNVTSCGPDTPLPEVAQLMCDNDCGGIPVLDGRKRPLGMVTDRDIACRAVAEGGDARQMAARDVMSEPVVTVAASATIDECVRSLEENQLRRILVVDAQGACCGIVAQADIARYAPSEETAEVVRAVSRSIPRGVWA
jgi:CBS domain-containing protein